MKKVAWLLVCTCTAVNALLIWNWIEQLDLSGARAAQADMGLYMAVSGISVIFIIILIIAVAITYSVHDRGSTLATILRYNNGICSIAFINSLIPILIISSLV